MVNEARFIDSNIYIIIIKTINVEHSWNISSNLSLHVIYPSIFLACPDHIHVEIDQDISKGGVDKLRLTSTLSGVSIQEVEYYWWLIHEINSPLYTFSVRLCCCNTIKQNDDILSMLVIYMGVWGWGWGGGGGGGVIIFHQHEIFYQVIHKNRYDIHSGLYI